MSNLKYFEDRIKEKRKNTEFREFLMEMGSWIPLVFYKNNGIISRFPKTKKVKITSIKEFEKNRENLINNGKKIDFSETFFDNFSLLFKTVELPAFIQYGFNENCDFCDSPADSKNVYLGNVVVLGSENVCYSLVIRSGVINCFNSVYVVENSENIYFCVGIISSFNIFYSSYIKNSSNVWFSSNLTGCQECLFCRDLENSNYCINNIKYSKEEYFEKKKSFLKNKSEFLNWYCEILKYPGKNHGSTNVEGNFILDSENIKNSMFTFNTKNGGNIIFAGANAGNENIYDSYSSGGGGGNDLYGALNSGGLSNNIYMSAHNGFSSNIYYSYFLDSCSFCLGCIGLKNKSYCILNKQYSKEEWYILVDKIFLQMEKDGILGEFFPGSLNPFYFNDTVAYLIDDSFTKEEVEKEGYMWREDEIKVDIPEGTDVVLTHPQPLPSKEGRSTKSIQDYQGYDSNGNWQINPEILKKVIKDEKGNIYRIVQMEYDFLMKHGIPLPEIHWLDRIKMGFRF